MYLTLSHLKANAALRAEQARQVAGMIRLDMMEDHDSAATEAEMNELEQLAEQYGEELLAIATVASLLDGIPDALSHEALTALEAAAARAEVFLARDLVREILARKAEFDNALPF